MSELASWLLAQIEADAAAARECAAGFGSHWRLGEVGQTMIEDETGSEVVHFDGVRCVSDSRHIARHDPARVLADCEAKKAIVEAFLDAADVVERIGPDLDKPGDAAEWANYHAWQEAVALLAQPFAGREGWRDEWGTNMSESREAGA